MKRANAGRLHETLVNAWLIRTWLAYRDGRLVTKAVWDGWDTTKPYPDFGWKKHP